MPIQLQEDVFVDVALMHKYGIITVLPFAKYASPIFGQMKPYGNLRPFVDLKKNNNLIADDHTTTIIQLAQCQTQHNTWQENLVGKLDCSQAYHCLQIAEQHSVKMLAFIDACGFFADKRYAQGLSRSVSDFSSFMREYLDPDVKADQCAQYMDIGIADNNATDITRNIRAVFK